MVNNRVVCRAQGCPVSRPAVGIPQQCAPAASLNTRKRVQVDVQTSKPSDFALFESDTEPDFAEAQVMAGCRLRTHQSGQSHQHLASPAAAHGEAGSAAAPMHPVTASPQAVRRATVPSIDGAAMPPAVDPEGAAADGAQPRVSKRLRLVTSSSRGT